MLTDRRVSYSGRRAGAARVLAVTLRMLFALVVLALALVAAEYILRFEFRRAWSSGNARDFIARRGGGPPISINSLGFRDREVPPKGPGRYRITVVGDSFTFGQGIEADERFSNLLERFLGARYEVLNFGKPGNNMPEHLDVLAQALTGSPDFVLLQLYINDFETPQMERPRPYPLLPGALNRNLQGSSMMYDLLSDRWVELQQTFGIADTYARYMERNLRDPNAPNSREAFGLLRQFIARSRAAGVPCGTVLFPAVDAMGANGAHYPFGYLHERVRTLCAEEKVPCLDLLPLFSTDRDPRSLWVSPFDAHPNAAANRRAAFEILHAFGSVWHR